MIWDPHALLMVDTNLVASETRTSLVREEAFKYAGNPLMRLEEKKHDSPRLYAIYTA
jgi:hypothetical protein